MQEKLIACQQQEFEKLAPLKDEVEQLREHTSQQDHELRRLTDYNNDLTGQMQSMLDEREKRESEMQIKLSQATDPEKLNSIRTRMDRYKQERDAARLQNEELATQVAVREAEKQEAIEQLEKASEQSERRLIDYQSRLSQQDELISRLSQCEARMRKYREERDSCRVRCKDLQKQVDNWKGLLMQIQQKQTQVAPSLNVEFDQTDDSACSLSPTHDQPSSESPLAEYHPSAHSEDQYQHDRESVESPMNEVERGLGSLTLEQSNPRPRKRTSSSGRSTGIPYEMVDVKFKEGTKVVYVQRCRGELNPKHKPKVIVKRGDEYEQGTLMFVGMVNGKELAGIHMDCCVTSK